MPVLPSASALSVLAAMVRLAPRPPVQALFRAAAYRIRPPRPVVHRPVVTGAQAAVVRSGRADATQAALLLCEQRLGATPTIVLGGFVPDATEQVYLLRGDLLRQGSVYYLHYPRGGFSAELLCAQLDDLVAELNIVHGQPPVVLGVSFGAGLVLTWLRRARSAGRSPALGGVLLVSPVACVADMMGPAENRTPTLIGRALKPYLDTTGQIGDDAIERSRAVFAKMFEAGAQNREALRSLLTVGELRQLRGRVLNAIGQITARGACERVAALQGMPPLSPWSEAEAGPLTEAPVLVLYAEKESAVITAGAPTRTALTTALPVFFPQGEVRTVSGGTGAAHPVQHASLIFHYYQFRPHIAGFYRRLKPGRPALAA